MRALPDVRPRTDADASACMVLARQVYDTDGYPSFLGDSGLERFIAPQDALASWVATIDDQVVGMVTLRPHSAPASGSLAAAALGVDEARLGFVARLEVAPSARRCGVARALLDTVVADARRRGLVAVLDVVLHDGGAVALYDASGWRRLGEHDLELRDGRHLPVAVYAAP
jgi:ribosomal protein S18 acetylase RimI-like enzyme